MEDLISRQEVIDLVEELEEQRLKGDIDLLYAPMIKGVRALPTAQKWISCSERLPQKERKEQRRGTYLTKNGYGVVCMMNYEFEGDFGFVGWGTNRPSDIQIVKWMSLPE